MINIPHFRNSITAFFCQHRSSTYTELRLANVNKEKLVNSFGQAIYA